MAIYYVGMGGNDGNSGLTWALRKLTLTGAESIPVVAGDTVYVGSGVYREQLTCAVNGGAGSYITYIGDVTGEHTDGVGGIVRISGSNNDQTPARPYCIRGSTKDYRIFRGFACDTVSTANLYMNNGSDHWIIEDCVFFGNSAVAPYHIEIEESIPTDIIIRRCIAFGGGSGILIYNSSDTAASDVIIENCIVYGAQYGVACGNVSDVIVRNCTFFGNFYGAYASSLNPGDDISVYNCVVYGCRYGLYASALGELISNFNNVAACWTNDYNNVAVGANDTSYTSLPLPLVLYAGASQISGYRFPWILGALSEWSELRAVTGANERTVDLFGIVRPVTPVKNSWGAVQFHDTERDATTTHSASVASIILNDAAVFQMWVPCDATSTTVSVYVYREANYAGNLPQMIVKQPGQADTAVTDVGAAGAWNLLTTTLTPSALPQYVLVELVSRNTAAAGNYATYFDDLVIA